MYPANFVYQRRNFQLSAFVSLLICSIASFAIPLIPDIWFLLPVFVVSGVAQAFYETGTYVFVVQLWGSKSAPMMQAMSFMLGSGGLIAPMVVKPFLTEMPEAGARSASTADVSLHIPYSILGSLFVLCSLSNLMMWLVSPETAVHESRSEEEDDVGKEKEKTNLMDWRMILLAVLFILFNFGYYGLEIVYGSYLMSFAVDCELKLSKQTGADLTTLFWATATLPTIAAAVLVKWTGDEVLMVISLIVTIIGNVILVPFGDKSEVCLWVGVVVVGIGMSSILGLIFSLVEEEIGLSARMSTLLIISCQVGEFVFPMIVSFFIEDNPSVFLWTSLSCTLYTCVLFLMIMGLKRMGKK